MQKCVVLLVTGSRNPSNIQTTGGRNFKETTEIQSNCSFPEEGNYFADTIHLGAATQHQKHEAQMPCNGISRQG